MDRDVVVIGGSAGALDPLKQIVTDLSPDTPASVLVVLHVAATAPSALAAILSRLGGMRAVNPRNGDRLRPGYIYVGSPNQHLEVSDGTIHLTHGPRVNGMRPAVDVLFRSAAAAYGPRVVGVILSGGLDDGSVGLAAIRAAGGVGIVQSPDDALMDSMPKNAIGVAAPDHVVPADKIGETIGRVLGKGAPQKQGSTGGIDMEAVGANDTNGDVTGVTCPDCHGSIWLQKDKSGAVAFTCRVGHSYSPESFFEIQAENVEDALWAGVRSLEEQASFAGVMASRANMMEDKQAAERCERRRRLAGQNAEVLRRLVLDRSEA
ncbi:MAG TPA: chemotaxis protein CheB [Candidatus Dormibacteraeota bacterium]|nr:chemotaxis protein CheB [Candidatus Dormibacteraeota bacterium]